MEENHNKPIETVDASDPQFIETQTQLTPDDMIPDVPEHKGLSEEEVEEAVTLINPDVSSMESRG